MENGTDTTAKGAERVRRKGTFQPGCKPGPGRKPKSEAMRLAEKLTKQGAQLAVEALMGKALVAVERSLRSPEPNVRLRAALSVLDRGLGMPTQRVDATITSNETATLVTVDQLRLAAMRLLATQATDAQEASSADR